MAEAQYAHNHTIDPETGFLESTGFSDAFDSTRKIAFLQCLAANDFDMNSTVKKFGISKETVYKHKRADQKFAEHWKEMVEEYAENLEWVSMSNALNPRSVIERIFQLKALRPEKYVPENRSNGNTNITIALGSDVLEAIGKRQSVIEAELVKEDLNSKMLDNQAK